MAVQSIEAVRQTGSARRLWSVVTVLIAGLVLLEAVFAGAMFSGVDWALTAHKASAVGLMLSTLIAGLTAVIALRRTQNGPRLGLTLLAMAAALFFQAAIGFQTAKGVNLLWLHVPLGVALFNFAVQAVAGARRLPGSDR